MSLRYSMDWLGDLDSKIPDNSPARSMVTKNQSSLTKLFVEQSQGSVKLSAAWSLQMPVNLLAILAPRWNGAPEVCQTALNIFQVIGVRPLG